MKIFVCFYNSFIFQTNVSRRGAASTSRDYRRIRHRRRGSDSVRQSGGRWTQEEKRSGGNLFLEEISLIFYWNVFLTNRNVPEIMFFFKVHLCWNTEKPSNDKKLKKKKSFQICRLFSQPNSFDDRSSTWVIYSILLSKFCSYYFYVIHFYFQTQSNRLATEFGDRSYEPRIPTSCFHSFH